jgi:tetratricopeptide (TPR) repeat protein
MQGDRWLERGARVGDYTIEGLLGEGGFGAVFRARSSLGIPAALKIFKTTGGEITAERLISQQNEIEALLRLDHPSLVELYGYGVLEGVGLFLAMELVEGETLDAYVARVGQLDTLEAVRLVRKVAEALAHCHARGVLHLDLKPSNIVLSDPHEPRLKILDFGLATLTSSWLPGDTRVTAGTVGYMAPECLRSGRARPDPRMDLYALGTILYELLAGRLPFKGRGQKTLMMQRAVGELIPLRDVLPSAPPAVAALLDDLLAQDPAHRPSSAAQLSVRLREIYYETLRGTENEEPPPSMRPPASSRISSMMPARSDDVPFVGRERELSMLAGRVLGASARGAAAVVVVGDAGIGKSRLIAELLSVVEQDGAAVVAYGRCRELSALLPYSPLREAIARLSSAKKRKDAAASIVTSAIEEALALDADMLRALLPELSDAHDGEVRRSLLRPASTPRVAELLRRMLGSIAARVPVLLAIEDLHWGDDATLAVLESLAGSLGAAPLLLLGTSRPPARVAWKGQEIIKLGPLDHEENQRLLEAVGRGADEATLRQLQESVPLLGAGNPLFDIQVARNLELEGFVARSPWGAIALGARNLADYRVPASIEEALRRGVDSLPRDAIEVLGVASLLGPRFLRSDLWALGLFDPSRVEQALAEGEQRCLCRTTDGATWFSHEAVREQLERRMVATELRAHHQRIARQLERRGASPDVLARHLERAGDTLQAAAAYLDAGLGERAHDPVGAGHHLHRAIDLVEGLPPSPEQRRILLQAAAELSRTRDMLGSTESILRLLERCAADPHPAPAAQAELGSAFARLLYARGDLAGAIAWSERALDAVGYEPSLFRHRSGPMNVLGRALAATGRLRQAIDALEEGCLLADLSGEATELCHSRGLYGVALARAGELLAGARQVQAAAELAERLNDPARLLGTWLCCALLAEARHDWDLGVSSTAQLLSYAEEHKLGGHYLYMGTLYAGRHQFHVGHLRRARMLITNALNLSRIVGTTLGRGAGYAFLGDVHLLEGDLAEARQAYELAVDAGNGSGEDILAACQGLVGLMHVHGLEGAEIWEVRRRFLEARARMEAAGQRVLLVNALQRYAELLSDLGAHEEALVARYERTTLVEAMQLGRAEWWPRIPEPVARDVGESPRSYWLSRRGKLKPSGLWLLPTTPVSPSLLLTSRSATKGSGSTVPQPAPLLRISSNRTIDLSEVGVERTAPRTGLLEALATVEGFVPAFDDAPRA